MREVALQNSFACHREIAGFGVDFFLKGAIARDLLYSVFYFLKKFLSLKKKRGEVAGFLQSWSCNCRLFCFLLVCKA